MPAPTPRDELARAIQRWEGLYSSDPDDQGNYIGARLLGTMRGVTAAVVATHRGIPPEQMTVDIVKSVTLEEAADIGVKHFYHGSYRLDTLPWGPTTAVLLDWTWGSGFWSIKMVQRLVKVHEDGVLGPQTRDAYANWVADHGWETTTRMIVDARRSYYLSISQPGTTNSKYRQGWLNRCVWQSPANAEWWANWTANMPPIPAPFTSQGSATPAPVPEPLKPASKSTTLRAAAGAVAGGAATAVDKATDGAVTDIVTETTSKLLGFATVGGIIMWIAVGLTVAGAGYAVWRVTQDRAVPR
jgi:lysozyme family protein